MDRALIAMTVGVVAFAVAVTVALARATRPRPYDTDQDTEAEGTPAPEFRVRVDSDRPVEPEDLQALHHLLVNVFDDDADAMYAAIVAQVAADEAAGVHGPGLDDALTRITEDGAA